MPLPAALLKRLKKRGIVSHSMKANSGRSKILTTYESPPVAPPIEPIAQEEVFAEDYDNTPSDFDAPFTSDSRADIGPQMNSPGVNDPLPEPASGCPNKWNAHHQCVGYCIKRWGAGHPKENFLITLKRLRMLRKYPLPAEWNEEYDPGTGRHYYWHKNGKEVCWLSPSHPKAQVCAPAQKYRDILSTGEDDEQSGDDDSASEEEEPDSKDNYYGKTGASKQQKRSTRERGALDPMDPAAYSDTCPRGGWKDGLEQGASKAADSTASGPLFQQRPYPSPGSILRMNKSKS